jgi:hypothetical protein
MRCRVLLLLLSLLASPALARDIFVDNRLGDDRRAGTSPIVTGETGPCLSIAKALRVAQPADRIVIANTGQPYREGITLQGARHSGTTRFPFTIVGNGAVLDGTMSLADANWEFVGGQTFRTRPAHMSFQQLFIDDQPVVRRQPVGGLAPPLAAREWCLAGGWIYFAVDEGRLPNQYDLSCCGLQCGITLYDVHDVLLQDLTIRGFWIDGANCHDNVRRADLVRLVAKENGRSGISIGGSSRVRVEGCTAADNGVAQLRVEGYASADLSENNFDATTAPAIVREGGKVAGQ